MSSSLLDMPRFGRSLARLRTAHMDRNRKVAKQWLKDTSKGRPPKLSKRASSLETWVKAADLHNVFEYLSC